MDRGAKRLAERIDRGDGLARTKPAGMRDHQADQAAIALSRVLRHQQRLRGRESHGCCSL